MARWRTQRKIATGIIPQRTPADEARIPIHFTAPGSIRLGDQRTVSSAANVFCEVADQFPEDPAVRHGAVTLTYSRLARMAGGIAARLGAMGADPGTVVATLLARSPWSTAAALGAWAAGAAYVHIEAADPDARIAAILTAARATAVLTDRTNAGRLPADTPPAVVLDDELPDARYQPYGSRAGEDLAYLVFTSGSTGAPKAVEIQHQSVLSYVAGFHERIRPLKPRSFGVTTTFASDLGNTCIFGALLSGARLDIYSHLTALDPDALARELHAHPVDCIKYTPSQLDAISRHGDLASFLPGSLLILGGESLPPRLACSIAQARPELRIYNHYGPSETTIGALMHLVRPADERRTRVPVGTPLPGVEIRVLDDQGEPAPEGRPGILYIGGNGVARGYLGDRELTAGQVLNAIQPFGIREWEIDAPVIAEVRAEVRTMCTEFPLPQLHEIRL